MATPTQGTFLAEVMRSTTLRTKSARVDEAVHKTSTRGRPRLLNMAERRQRLVTAAEYVFVEMGYGAASMDGVARRAGMSKKTIYQVFETKQELFAAVIESRRDELAAMIESEGSDETCRPEDVLRRFLSQIARFVLAPRQAALYRLAVAESQRAPELANAFYREGSTKACSALMHWLALQHERGILHVPDSGSAAKMLFHMAIAELQMRLLIGDCQEPDPSMIDERVEAAVRLFLDGARVRGATTRHAPLQHPTLASS
jgi:AcrR family transcriptional regulator